MTALIKVKTNDVGCRKPGCSRRLDRPDRHHRRQETLFINAYRLRGPKKTKDERYHKLVRTYEKFRDEDCVVLCPSHHCEIHLLYDKIILEDQIQRRKRLRDYTWPQAYSLMNKLRQACLDWEEEKTPGVDPGDCEPEKRFEHRPKRRRGKRGQ